ELRASSDNFSSDDNLIFSKSNIARADLVGPLSEDLIITGSLSTAYRYWRIEIDTSVAIVHKFRKLYFGEMFDFSGRSPQYPYAHRYNTSAGKNFASDAGVIFSTSSGGPRRELNLNWYGFSDEDRETYQREIEQYAPDFPVV